MLEDTLITTINQQLNISTVNNSNKDLDEVQYTSDYEPYESRPETYIIPVLFSIIFIVGVLGNGTLIIIFLRHRAMRNVPNTYIVSLALADLLVILICVPLASIIYTFESWQWGVALCRISECAKDISIGVSVFTLTALSAERYCAIVNPLRKLQTRPLTVLTATLIWLLAILCATPAAIKADIDEAEVPGVNGTNRTIYYCTPYGRDSFHSFYAKSAVCCKAFIYYLLPLSIIAALYIMMARRLHVSAREMPGEMSGPQSRAQATARRHVARMVIAFVLIFFICFFPYHVFEVWFHVYPNAQSEYDTFWHILRIVGFCTSFLNSCVNPVALYFISGVFRQHFHRYLCCRHNAQPSFRGHHSTGADTSFMSVRRSTTNNYRNSSVYINNNVNNYHNSLHHHHHHHHHQQQQQQQQQFQKLQQQQQQQLQQKQKEQLEKQEDQGLQLQHTVINSNGTGTSPPKSIILNENR
ncbi:neuropeptide CCHamide-2 receptor-like [Condylostylus longicornis]|uniref:neuropeptide CCHamide-2 receptor-like n=1 Tax=Condylostylus longicornis TaxID=2530218 RepID=UPI00244E3FC2|nr:neuropeptide CCHamide-2 receptor-like [Condylostylus longicornis]